MIYFSCSTENKKRTDKARGRIKPEPGSVTKIVQCVIYFKRIIIIIIILSSNVEEGKGGGGGKKVNEFVSFPPRVEIKS